MPSPWFTSYPVLPWYDPRLMCQAPPLSYQSMFVQHPYEYFQQQGMRGPGLTTDVASMMSLGLPPWYQLRGLLPGY